VANDLKDLARTMRLKAAGQKLQSGQMAEAYADYLALAREGFAPAQHVTALCLASEDMTDADVGLDGQERDAEAAAWDFISHANGFEGAGAILEEAEEDPEWHAEMLERVTAITSEHPDALRDDGQD